ncbi:MAG: class II fumarate hydratase [Simkaniaceae bacterium]|nr:class II fumarate hydratase [Simkaniaceae bacterium]
MRVESDSLGEVQVPDDRYWGAQTERALRNFPGGSEKMPVEVIHAQAMIKKAVAIVNAELGLLSGEKRDRIVRAVDVILTGKLDDHFPLLIWQTGSGTQTNMNVNEVIANYASHEEGEPLGSKRPLHPNDDVNLSQSSNDTFPTAMHIAAVLKVHDKLLPRLGVFLNDLEEKEKEFADIIKIGRTHLMDAVPLTLGHVFSGYASQIRNGMASIRNALSHLSEIALGGTAVGTGLNTRTEYADRVAKVLSELTDIPLLSACNKFEALASSDAVVEMSGALKRVAGSLLKIVNDMRYAASGPRSGIGELILPANEPGSSIMPGKVNPTQCEALSMIVMQVFGSDVTIGFSGASGAFELNVYRPVMIYHLLRSMDLLADGVESFRVRCLDGIRPNRLQIKEHVDRSLMLVTALNPVVGYDKAAAIAKKAYVENITLREAALALNALSEEEFDEAVDPAKMLGPRHR